MRKRERFAGLPRSCCPGSRTPGTGASSDQIYFFITNVPGDLPDHVSVTYVAAYHIWTYVVPIGVRGVPINVVCYHYVKPSLDQS